MVYLIYAHFDKRLPDEVWNHYFCTLPENIQNEIKRYQRWQDRQSRLIGKFLLREGLQHVGYNHNCLDTLSLDQYGRPFIDHKIDFNISHSEGYVVCAITDQGRLGIDIERITPIELSDFEKYMTSDQWEIIRKSGNSYKGFYDYWTIKESVLKADGRGFSIPLEHIRTKSKKAVLHDTIWFLKKIDIHSNYSCHLAMNNESQEMNLIDYSGSFFPGGRVFSH